MTHEQMAAVKAFVGRARLDMKGATPHPQLAEDGRLALVVEYPDGDVHGMWLDAERLARGTATGENIGSVMAEKLSLVPLRIWMHEQDEDTLDHAAKLRGRYTGRQWLTCGTPCRELM